MTAHAKTTHYLVSTALTITIILSGCGEGAVGTLGDRTLTLDALQSRPSPGAEDISTTSALKIVVKEELELSTVNNLNVHLMPGQGHSMDAGDDGAEEDATLLNNDPIPGTVTYNALTRTITFTPTKAMDQGRSYHVHASNLLLKGGKKVSAGVDTIQYSFTTSHAHEFYRKEFNDAGQVKEERYTDTTNNVRVMRKQYEYDDNRVKTLDYIRHYGPTHTFSGKIASDISVYYQQDGATNGIQRYEVKRRGSDGNEYNVRVRFSKPYPATTNILTDPVHNIWTADEKHGTNHQISYQYEPIVPRNERSTNPTFWPTNGNPKTSDKFQLDDAQLMEMDHSASVSNTTNPNDPFQHRHIFYGDLGDNKQIDFNSQHNPVPIDDEIRVYHTRDIVNYLRTHEWSWLGIDRDGTNKSGPDGQSFTPDDVASRLRVYVYDSLGRRAQRVSYEVADNDVAPYGLSRTEWTQVLTQSGYKGHQLAQYGVAAVNGDQPAYLPNYSLTATNGVAIKVHSYRIYEYEPDTLGTDPTTLTPITVAGGLSKVTVWHENSTDTDIIKEEIRYYTTQPNVQGETLATQSNL